MAEYFATGKFRNCYIETENFDDTMVILATLDTNIRDIVRDPVDQNHGILYPRYHGDPVIVKDYGPGNHTLDLSTGRLQLGNIQQELPVVDAIVRYDKHGPDPFHPMMTPSKGDWWAFSTIFELERLASVPIVINGIAHLSSDRTTVFTPEHSYFREQKAALDEFIAAYANAVATANFGKPILEGFYEAMKRQNVNYLDNADEECTDPDQAEKYARRRTAFWRLVLQEEDFVTAFGKTVFDQLRTTFGEPRFK